MKHLVVLLLAIAGAVSGLDLSPGFLGRYDDFFQLPKTEDEAISSGWLKTDSVERAVSGLSAYCSSDYVMCVFFEDTGYAAGLQIAVSVGNITETIYDWDVQGFSLWTAPNGVSFRTLSAYFVNEEYLKIEAATRIAQRDPNKLYQLDGVWVSSINKQLLKIASTDTVLLKDNFVKTGCRKGMGYHYIRDLKEDLPCAADTLIPWFPLVFNGQLTGIEYVAYVNLPVTTTSREWLERQIRTDVEDTVKNGPQCLYELVDKPGMLTQHVYFIQNPMTIECDLPN